MDNNISESWNKSAAYLKEGISLIPVRDKADSKYPAKTPYFGWKKYQEVAITEAELFQSMEKFNTTATAFICGAVSGNLEIIDVDAKNWEGIEVMLFEQIEKLLPKVWSKLRIHKTPSGGRHIIYKIEDHAPEGNLKLAWKEGEKEAAIETRGEGGYALTDASMNYVAEFDRPIPVISWLDRCSLKAICESFNQKVKVEAIKPAKSQSEFYDENPFEDFNHRDNGNVLAENGWKALKQSAKFIWYTRPGKTEGISASFNKEKNIYFIFTSSTEFEPSKGYFPSMVLSKLKFNSDNKECYKWLVDNGFGKVNKVKEIKFAETYAKQKTPLPNNFSKEAKDKYQETTEKIAQAYPFGEFIKWNKNDEKMEVSREAFYTIAGHLGFRIFRDQVVRVVDQLVHKCTEREFYDQMKEYIKNDDPEELEELLNIYEKFIQKNGTFTQTRLPEFDTEALIKDDRHNGYLFFTNCWLHITAKGTTVKDYSELDQLVMAERVKDREYYDQEEGGIYADFIEKAIGFSDYVASIIGFLCHNFKDETTGFLPVFGEQCENPEDGGGAGKNVLCNSFGFTTSYLNKNCAGVKYDEKFFQMWTGQRILGLSDLPEHFNFLDLKEAITGSFIHKRLFKDEIEVRVHDTPKMVCQTNYAVEIKDGGIARRVCLVEFTDFFTKAGGVDTHYGKHFPNDWTKEDWNGYDNVIAECISIWIGKGCKIVKPSITASGWKKQFAQTYGQTITDIIATYIDKWQKAGKITKDDFNKDLNQYYSENNIQKKYEVSSHRMNKALVEYCKHYDIPFEKDHLWSEMGIKIRGKLFGVDLGIDNTGDVDYEQ